MLKGKVLLLGCALAALFSGSALANGQSFEQALASAYLNNPSLQAQRARLRATDEKVAQAQSGWRPSADLVGGIGSSKQKIASGGMFSGSDTLTPRDIGVQITQPVFQGFRTVSSVDAARSEVKAGQAVLQAFEQHTLLAAAKAYLDVVEALSVLDLTRHNEQVLQEQLAATQKRFESGEVTKTDISQAQARLSVALASRIQAEGQFANSKAAYQRIIGQEPEGVTQPRLSLDLPKSLDEALALAQKANPEVSAALFAQDAAKSSMAEAKGSLLPDVNLVATASRGWEQSLMLPKQQDESTIMARMTIPLYRAGADYAKIRAAQETAVQSGLELDDARQKMRQNVVTAWESLMTARASIKAHQAAVEATQLALQGVRVESGVGQRTTLDVLNAEQEMLTSKVNLVKAQHDEAFSMLQLRSAMGTLTAEALKLPVQAYDAKAHADEADGKWIGY